MESINVNTDPVVAVPQMRTEVYCPFKKFILASDFGVPSRDPTSGALGGVQLYWEVLYDQDPNSFITLQPGYIDLNKPGIYMVSARVTFRADSDANTQRLLFMAVDLDALAGANQGDGDIASLSVSRSAHGSTSTLYLSESSPGAGDSGGSSLLTTAVVPVIRDTIYAPPRAVAVFVFQESDSLQGQNLKPHNYDVWLQVAFLGKVDTLVDGATIGTVQ